MGTKGQREKAQLSLGRLVELTRLVNHRKTAVAIATTALPAAVRVKHRYFIFN